MLLFGKARATYVPAFGAVNVAVPVRTDQSTYAAGASIRVAYAGMPGYPDDWIAIARPGSANTSYLTYVLTSGQTSGTATFIAPSAGTYVARAFPNNTFALLAESAQFATTNGTVTTDKSSYPAGAVVTVTYAGLPGYLDDWIAIAPAGSADTSYLAYVLTNGQTSGTTTFTAPSAGTYVARAFPANTFARLAESPPFSTTGGTSRSP